VGVQTITDEAGRGIASGRTPRQIADALAPTTTIILDDLDQWPAISA
jgi:hypothetical protein